MKPVVQMDQVPLRDAMVKDCHSTLKRVTDTGCKVVEAFGYAGRKFFGRSPNGYAAKLTEHGLKSSSGPV
jgi:hypothetical protein